MYSQYVWEASNNTCASCARPDSVGGQYTDTSPGFAEKLYTGPGKRRHRWSWYTAQFGIPESMFGTTDHESHRIRRAAVNPFFSKGAVRRLQPIIDERINALLDRFRQFQVSGAPITLNYAFSAYTNGGSRHATQAPKPC